MSKCDYKPGDKLKCVSADIGDRLKIGEVYTYDYYEVSVYGTIFIFVKELPDYRFRTERFTKVADTVPEDIKILLNENAINLFNTLTFFGKKFAEEPIQVGERIVAKDSQLRGTVIAKAKSFLMVEYDIIPNSASALRQRNAVRESEWVQPTTVSSESIWRYAGKGAYSINRDSDRFR